MRALSRGFWRKQAYFEMRPVCALLAIDITGDLANICLTAMPIKLSPQRHLETEMKTYTSDEAAKFLATDVSTVRALIDDGFLPAAKIGRAWVMLESDLVDFLSVRIREQTAERIERAAITDRNRNQSEVSQTRRYRGRRRLPELPELPGERGTA
jgi:excisionase family DNA binding protein